jgi:hypothetical protein
MIGFGFAITCYSSILNLYTFFFNRALLINLRSKNQKRHAFYSNVLI